MAILTGSFIVLLALGLPIGIVLAGASLLFIMQDPLLSEATVFRSFFNFVSKYTLMAVPFFIYAGFLMERTGLIDRLFRFADALIGWVPGGFGFATLLAAIIFGAISGSSTAMAAAMGVIAYPEMRRRGYPAWLAAGLIASGGGIAILIPPSITLILYGVMTETSIVSLFFAGVVPGLLLALGNAVALVFFALYLKLPSGEFRWRALLDATKEAWPALLMPVLILGGLYGGLFTPTEAGAAACGYALIYGAIARRRAFLADLVAVTQRSLNLTAVIIFLLGCVGVFQFVLANQGWAQHLTQWAGNLGLSPLGFLAVLMPILLFLSMFLSGIAIVVLTVPLFFPIAMALGIDPIYLAILVALAMEMGVIIPPVGLNLFAVAGTTRVPLHEVIWGSSPFLLADGCVLLLVMFFPILALWLPGQLVVPVFN
ncbi:TRAP transporter large permease [Crenalkalicoccus roseus]|uniref:TRAP transporter large permease n=1 Tax=Crenalkalicoccus roseus TaxID=1485588 RepID=UPI001081A5A5|nr:TRAP transporter large permease [Crenalkalicoccus roseus]